MSIYFNLGEFREAFDAAVGQQRAQREPVDFEFEGQRITIQGRTKLSDAVVEYFDSLSSDQNFTGPERFEEKEPGALRDYIEENQNSLWSLGRSIHAAKLLQQATRNGRPLEDVWLSSAPLDGVVVEVLESTWAQGKDLKTLWKEREKNKLGLAYG